MNNDEVFDLLSVIQAYDGRTVGESDALVWSDAAERGRWSYEEARDAVKAHYAEEITWLMPGHVTQRIKTRRSQPPRSTALPSATPQPAADAHRDRVVGWLAERVRADRDQRTSENRQCLTVSCPQCQAQPDQVCAQTGRRSDTRRAPIEIPHVQRHQAYRQTQE